MSDTAPRNPSTAPQMLADALLRSVGGAAAQLRISTTALGTMQEVGLVATTLSDVVLGPVVLRKLRPVWRQGDQPKWELLLSATSVEQQIRALSLDSAQALFAMAAAVTVGGQDYLIESVGSNEAFGTIYLYRVLLSEARPQSL